MINRKQAAELLGNVHPRFGTYKSTMEAVYSAADEATRAILDANPDLRLKAVGVVESYVRASQDEKDFVTVLSKIRQLLDPDLIRKEESDNSPQAQGPLR